MSCCKDKQFKGLRSSSKPVVSHGLDDFALWKTIFEVQNGSQPGKKKACCDGCADGHGCADDHGKTRDCRGLFSTSGPSPIKVPGSSKVMWVNTSYNRDSSVPRSSTRSDLRTADSSSALLGASLKKVGCCSLKYSESLFNSTSINYTIYPSLNQPFLDRFTAKTIINHKDPIY